MMFNGLLLCGDSDTSDCTKESLGADSPSESSASGAARAHALENKLLATMQILKNKEETVRVQAESLALAEARIANLTSKTQACNKLHQAQQTHPLYSTRSAAAGCHIEMTDVSASADLQDMDHKIVSTLRDNLSVIEELYRECFYESAKQEELINTLRRSYLEIRLMERQKTEQIQRLQAVVHTQRCSLERCQDIALEVENLKSEISNFLNSSQNNDSVQARVALTELMIDGVWEREECAGDAADDLRAIADQLRHLRDMLNTDCTCGLEEENVKLKRINETIEMQIVELRQRIKDLEEALQNKENLDQQYHLQIQEKNQELHYIRHKLLALEEGSRYHGTTCEALNNKLKKLEVLLNDKTSELLNVQEQCRSQEATIKELREELNKADVMAQDSGQVRAEVSCLSTQVSQWRTQMASTRRRLQDLEAELQRARDHCKHLAEHYRDKARVADELQSRLEEGQSRGRELCGEARRAVCGVRRWLRDQRQINREQEETIKQQEILIRTLQLAAATPASERMSTSDNEPCCSKFLPRVEARCSDRSFVSAKETSSCSKCPSLMRMNARTSASETASSPTPPTPPRRLLRKKPLCGNIRCEWARTRSCGVQRPHRSDAGVDARPSRDLPPRASSTREMSPPDELLERVERAHEALSDAHRRWSRGAVGARGGR